MQLAFLDTKLSKEVKRKTEKLISSYKNLEAIIESKKMDAEHKMTVNYQPSESQRGNQFHSETEKIAELNIEIKEHLLTMRKLNVVYHSLKPIQQRIWDQKFLRGRYDVDVYSDLDIPDRTYYRLKREMIAVVAEAFGFI
ncbi:ArpU family phage packaging/lysis transcriptional regulator [Cytobacillus sp. FSL W8-0315]|uniref:ArpU family phage packaging/lysis transcriptional regulator n=1 Tax=Cytobacillus sp. FSL W8-0315 TaxID=2921600 RepID=UPI0030F903F1